MSMVRRLAATVIIMMLVAITMVVQSSGMADAASASDFNPAFIVSDEEFYNANAMTAAEIQTFLNQRVPTCHPELSNGPSDPIVCLKDYRMTTVTQPADAYCKGTYVGAANESAATIIYKVSQACGVSPKALLVTLEKEQGLVTHTWPSSYRYDKAMGFACPDTAPCDTQYFGFQNQVWRAARQFQRYKASPSSYNYRAGVPNIIGYNPNAACGSSTVVIQNQATAGLYNYTPYQPNAAALNNLYGTGDGCSAYGNRNFWRLWTDWFGSPTAIGQAQIDAAYVAVGGSSVLGAGVANLNCPASASRCWPQYANGSIYWSPGTGAGVVLGAKDVAYRALGGPDSPLGYPQTGEYTYSENGGGSAQIFEKGALFESAAGIYPNFGAVRQAYLGKTGAQGELGWPTSTLRCVSPNCAQIYEHGAIAVTGTDVAYIGSAEREVWVEHGGVAGSLGIPTMASVDYVENGGGSTRVYQGGSIFTSPSGTFAVTEPIRSAYFSKQGAWGELGWPSGKVTTVAGTSVQFFQHGAIVLLNGSPYFLGEAEGDAWVAAGGPTGALGMPTSDLYRYTENGGGTARVYVGGSIFASSAGTFAVTGPIRTAYFSKQGAWGVLGWPTAAMTCSGGTCSQTFQGGTVFDNGTITLASGGGGGSTYVQQLTNVVASLGLTNPTSGILEYTENGGGVAQVFGTTTVFSSAVGAYAVSDAMRTAYFSKQGAWGELGWPSGKVTTVAGTSVQFFQHGAIVLLNGSPYFLGEAEGDAWVAAGGPTGALGMPTSDLYRYTENGGGTARVYVGGSIFASSAGTFAVLPPVKSVYFASQGAWGSYGWPTAPMQCGANSCSQTFQNGAIAVPKH